MKKLAVLILLDILFSTTAFGWGQIGHRVVGEIAQRHLSHSARKKLRKLMGKESLAQSSTWADEIRSHPNQKYYSKFSPWHYVEIPIGVSYEDSEKNKGGDIIRAIQEQTARLKNRKNKPEERIEALRFLSHFVGDIHQPLHVGNGLDQGSNFCIVKFFGVPTNLHKVWDESLIDSLKLSYTEFAQFIDQLPKSEIKKLQKSTVLEWAKESEVLRPTAYPSPIGKRAFCKKNYGDTIDDDDMPGLSWDYRFKHLQTVRQRLFQAGVRLAALLDDAL